MTKKRHRERISKTVHLKPDNEEFVVNMAKKEERSFSNMLDLLISRMRQQQEERA